MTNDFTPENFLPITSENASEKNDAMFSALRSGELSYDEAYSLLEQAACDTVTNDGLVLMLEQYQDTVRYLKNAAPDGVSMRDRMMRFTGLLGRIAGVN